MEGLFVAAAERGVSCLTPLPGQVRGVGKGALGEWLGRAGPETVFEDGTAELRCEEMGRGPGGRASQILD